MNKNRTFETFTIEVEPKCDFGSKEEEKSCGWCIVGPKTNDFDLAFLAVSVPFDRDQIVLNRTVALYLPEPSTIKTMMASLLHKKIKQGGLLNPQ